MAKVQEIVAAKQRQRAKQTSTRKTAAKRGIKMKAGRATPPAPAPAKKEEIAKPAPAKVKRADPDVAPPRIAVEELGPEEAIAILETNSNNRPVRDSRVMHYADAMRAGEWDLNNDAIVLSWPTGEPPKPVLLNGQHRLFAILESGTRQRFAVMRHADPAWQERMDTGAIRTADERWGLRGDMGKVSRREVAVARFLAGQKQKTMTNDQERDFFSRHREAIHFACTHIKPGMRGISHTAVLAVIARGYYHLSQTELSRFCEVLTSNIPKGEGCMPIFMLRKHLTDKAGMGSFGRADAYQRSERALKAFMSGEAPAKLYAAERELFPLPEEKGQA